MRRLSSLLMLTVLSTCMPQPVKGQKLGSRSAPSFKDYVVRGVPKRNGRLTLIERWTEAESKAMFNHRVRRAVGTRPSFAGRYAVVAWSCGWICANLVIVDVKTRSVYDTPFVGISDGPCPKDFNAVQKGMIDFRLNSRLFILRGAAEDPLPGKTMRDAPCSTRYYVWEKDHLTLVREVLAAKAD